MEVKDGAHFGRLLEFQEERQHEQHLERRRAVAEGVSGTIGCLLLVGLAAAVILLIVHGMHHR